MAEGQTIELDCPPGYPRPGDLIKQVIYNTGLPLRESASRLFGSWTWDYNDIDPYIWNAAYPLLKARIMGLYNAGVIRYGSW